MTGVSGSSDTDLWAVGYFYDQPQGRYLPLTQHWNGRRFQYVHAPTASLGYNAFNAVATIAPDDAWAVGYQTPVYYTYVDRPLIEHWDGTSWTVVPSPYRNEAELSGVAAIAANDVWAVGSRSGGAFGSLILHWDGQRWSLVDDGHAADLTALRDVVVNGPKDVWAGGSASGPNGTIVPFAEHWDGTSWTGYPASSNTEYAEFNAIAAGPDGGLWGAGWQSPGLGSYQMTKRLDANGWHALPMPDYPANNTLYGMASVGPVAWTVGYGSTSGPTPLIERSAGNGWVVEPNPAQGMAILYSITAVGRKLWTVGDSLVMRRGI
jgi:hypothetical protein